MVVCEGEAVDLAVAEVGFDIKIINGVLRPAVEEPSVIEVLLEPGSPLREWAGGAERVRVNSVHSQGARELGAGLRVEARAPDGLVEAFSVAAAPAFAFAVQWHPEWQVMDNDFSRALFAAFGAAARARVASRQG